MANTIEATFDGKVLHPDEPLQLAPNTRVRIAIEEVLPAHNDAPSFLQLARSLRVEGPRDWSANLDKYLYGHFTDSLNDEDKQGEQRIS